MRHDAKIPSGPIQEVWEKCRFEMKLVNPANKRKYEIIVVGSGLAGGAGAATLAELGYNVKCFCYPAQGRVCTIKPALVLDEQEKYLVFHL